MKDVPDLISNWDFVRSGWRLNVRPRRWWRAHAKTKPVPPHAELKPIQPRDAWAVYFVYLPKGLLSPSHYFTLARLRDSGLGIFIVCATPEPSAVPAELLQFADAALWKGLSGYDFSAYSLALHALSRSSPGATVFFLNDSVDGPFADLRTFMKEARWDLTGMTGSALVENHLQSYAFILKGNDAERARHLRPAFPDSFAFDEGGDVILCQETYFARLASYSMSVGAFWYAPNATVPDPTLTRPLQLLDAGFPFLKKSLFGKHSKFQTNLAREELHERMRLEGHPGIAR